MSGFNVGSAYVLKTDMDLCSPCSGCGTWKAELKLIHRLSQSGSIREAPNSKKETPPSTLVTPTRYLEYLSWYDDLLASSIA